MATLRETLQYAQNNPNDPRNQELFKAIKGGVFDEKAKQEGVDLSGIRPQFDSNLGVGFDATFQSNADDGLIKSTAKTVGNVPKSAFELGKNVISAVASPIDTVKSIFGLVKGAGTRGAREITERIPATAERAEQVPVSQEEQQFNQFLGFVKDRYGSIESFKETVVEDPVGALADVAAIATGTGGALKVGGLQKAGTVASRAGQVAEPLSLASKGVSSATSGVSRVASGRLGQIVSEVIPGFREIKDKAVTKALDMTQGDVAKFTQRRDLTPGEYITQKTVDFDGQQVPLLGDTVAETADRINLLKNNSYSGLRDELARVQQTYNATEVPRVKETLKSIADDIKDVPGLEDDLLKVQDLLNKESYTLTDIQSAKEIFDERYNIFNKSGDPKAGDRATGLRNVREDIKEFIEVEGDKFDIDVRQMNDDVSVAYELEKAIEKGATRDLTRNQIGLSDHIIGTGLGIGVLGGGISLPTAVGIFLAKRTIESPTFRIALAQSVSKLDDLTAGNLTRALQKGTLTDQQKTILRGVIEEAQTALPVVESGSKIIEESNSETEVE